MLMRDQTTHLIIVLIIVGLTIFAITMLGKAKVLDIGKNLENLNLLKFFDQYSEALIKSFTYKMTEKSVFEAAREGLGKYLWYNYPDCGDRPPTLDRVNSYLIDKIRDKLDQIEEFIKLVNKLRLLYPLEIYYNFDNVIIELPFNETDLNSGAVDEGFPIVFRNVSIYIRTPFGEAKKIYDFSLYINRTRVYYLYRTARDWLNNGGYIRLIKDIESREGPIYTCNYGTAVLYTPNFPCALQQKIVCTGQEVIVTLKEIIQEDTVRICVWDPSQIDQINQRNQQVEQNCNHVYQIKQCQTTSCTTTYSISSRCIGVSKPTYNFAATGSRGSSSGGGGGGGGSNPPPPQPPPCPKWVDVTIKSCVNQTVDVQQTGNQCTSVSPANPGLSGPPCPDGISCPDTNRVRRILSIIRDELEKTLNGLFDQYVKCSVDLRIDKIECIKSVDDKNKNIGKCACGISAKSDMIVIATYFVRCTDYKYYSFIENKLKNLELDFQLGVKGRTNCPYPQPPPVPDKCCDVFDIKGQKMCCLDCVRDQNGNCIDCVQCPGQDRSENVQSTESAICLQ